MIPPRGCSRQEKRHATSTHRFGLFCFLLLIIGTSAWGGDGPDPLETGIDRFRAGYREWDIASLIDAATSLQQACAVHPGSPEARYWLAAARFHILLHRRNDPQRPQTRREFEALSRSVHETLREAIDIDRENGESHAMLAAVTGMEIARGVRSGFWGGRALQKHRRLAMKYGEDNPRVQYLLGVGTIQGRNDLEGLNRGIPVLLRAEDLFAKETEEQRPRLQPGWGYDHCLVFIGRAYRRLGESEKARRYFEKALTVNPSSGLADRELRSMEEKR